MAVIFIFLVLLAWFFYLRREKVYALIIFFFFLTAGFHLVPEEAMQLMTGFSKGNDYALVLIAGCIGFDFFLSKGRYFKSDGFTVWVYLFLAFLLVCIIYSINSRGCTLYETIKTSRQYLLIVSYFVLRKMTYNELERLLKGLFYIGLGLCGIYALQLILLTELLNEGTKSEVFKIGNWKVIRYYNQPYLMYFCAFLAITSNITKGMTRIVSIVVFVLAILFGFHRSGTGFFILALILGYVLRLDRIKQVRIMIVAIAILIPSIVMVGHNFVKSKTYQDVQAVIDGRFADANVDVYLMYNSTFSFRMGHLYERMKYIDEHPPAKFLGVGLIPEESPKSRQFNFLLGLSNEKGESVQIETSDISYSPLFLRFGYLGTAIFLALYIYMAVFFFKRKKCNYALSSFIYLILLFGLSFFSSMLSIPIFYLLPMITMCLVKKDSELIALSSCEIKDKNNNNDSKDK